VEAAAHLVSTLPRRATFVASAERRCWESLPGRTPRHDPRLNDVNRPGERWSSDFRRQRRRWVEGVPVEGWERHGHAAQRFADAVDAATAEGARDVVIVSHGMVLTNWLTAIGALDRDEAGAFWELLTFPDCWTFDDGVVMHHRARTGARWRRRRAVAG
jgi:broad specificity phosphatase PhoE